MTVKYITPQRTYEISFDAVCESDFDRLSKGYTVCVAMTFSEGGKDEFFKKKWMVDEWVQDIGSYFNSTTSGQSWGHFETANAAIGEIQDIIEKWKAFHSAVVETGKITLSETGKVQEFLQNFGK